MPRSPVPRTITGATNWRHYLPRAKSKRGRRRPKGRSSAVFITHRKPFAERPPVVAQRQTPGHWDADLMLFSSRRQAVLALHERYSRLLIAVRLPGKAATPVANAIQRLLAPLPPPLAANRHLRQRHRVRPLSPTPRPRYPNLLLRHSFPLAKGHRRKRHRPYAPSLASQNRPRQPLPGSLYPVVQAYNNTPRKRLGYHTPAEVFSNQLLHFKCESTFPLSWE